MVSTWRRDETTYMSVVVYGYGNEHDHIMSGGLNRVGAWRQLDGDVYVDVDEASDVQIDISWEFL